MSGKTKEELEAEIESMAKVVAKAEKARVQAEEMAKLAMAESARFKTARAAETGETGKAPTEPVTADDILDDDVREMLDAAKELALDYEDGPAKRAPLAARAQGILIALRELDVAYTGHGIELLRNPTPKRLPNGQITRGDLFVLGAPCHPRAVAERLTKGVPVGSLVDLCDALKAKLENEATPNG